MPIELVKKDWDDERKLEEILADVGKRDVAGKHLLVIHPKNNDHLADMAIAFANLHGDANVAIIPYSVGAAERGLYYLPRIRKNVSTLRVRTLAPCARIGDLLAVKGDDIAAFMRADWAHAVPWPLLFRSVPYASLSLRILAAASGANTDIEQSLVEQLRSEAQAFGVSPDGDPLDVASNVLAAWAR